MPMMQGYALSSTFIWREESQGGKYNQARS